MRKSTVGPLIAPLRPPAHSIWATFLPPRSADWAIVSACSTPASNARGAVGERLAVDVERVVGRAVHARPGAGGQAVPAGAGVRRRLGEQAAAGGRRAPLAAARPCVSRPGGRRRTPRRAAACRSGPAKNTAFCDGPAPPEPSFAARATPGRATREAEARAITMRRCRAMGPPPRAGVSSGVLVAVEPRRVARRPARPQAPDDSVVDQTVVVRVWTSHRPSILTRSLHGVVFAILCPAPRRALAVPRHRQIEQAAKRPAADPHRLAFDQPQILQPRKNRRQRHVGDHARATPRRRRRNAGRRRTRCSWRRRGARRSFRRSQNASRRGWRSRTSGTRAPPARMRRRGCVHGLAIRRGDMPIGEIQRAYSSNACSQGIAPLRTSAS